MIEHLKVRCFFFIFKKFGASALNAATRLVAVVVIVKKTTSSLNHKKITERGTINIHFISLCYRIYLTKRSESNKFKGFLR